MRAPSCKVSIILVLFVSLLSVCKAQECVTGCAANLTQCSIIDYPIYVSDYTFLAAREARAKQFLLEAKFLPATCVAYLKEFICNVFHPSCNPDDLANPVKILPSVQICLNLLTVCGAGSAQIVPFDIAPYFNCTGRDSSGNYIYQQDSTLPSSHLTNNASLCPSNAPPTTLQYAGACQKFDPYKRLSTAPTCSSFVSENIFVPANWPMIQFALDPAMARVDIGLKAAFKIMPTNCYKHVSAFFCGQIFPTCYTVDIPAYNTTAAISQIPCKSFCEDTYSICYDFFQMMNITKYLAPCNNYPTGVYPINVGGVLVNTTCRNYIIPKNPALANYTVPHLDKCPIGTGRKINVNENETKCGLACPDASYTPEEWHQLAEVTAVGASLTLVFMSFLAVSYLVSFEKRKFPSIIHMFEFLATAGFAVAFLINGKDPEKDVWCYDEGTYATQHNNSACAAQGFLFIFFGLALAVWCLIIAYMIFYGIVLHKKVKNLRSYTKHFLVLGWGIPLVFAIAAISSGSIGYGPPLAWCFVHFNGFGYGGGFSRDYPLFYIPALLIFTAVFLMFLATVGKIIYVRKFNIENSFVARRGSRTFKAQVRILLFILMVFIICLTIFQWRFEIEKINSDNNFTSVGLNWVFCKMRNSINLPLEDAGYCPEKTNPARISYSRTSFESFVLSGIGILIFLGFGSDPAIYRHWMKLFKLAMKQNWQGIREFVLLGKDPFKGTSSSSGTPTNRKSTNTPTGDSSSPKGSGVENSASKKSKRNSPSVVDDVELPEVGVTVDVAGKRSKAPEFYLA